MTVNAARTRRFVNPRAAGEYVGVHLRTIYRMIDSGELPAYRMGNRRIVRIDLDDLDRMLVRVPNAAMFDETQR